MNIPLRSVYKPVPLQTLSTQLAVYRIPEHFANVLLAVKAARVS